jgi:predicted RND superfamily exporter protein
MTRILERLGALQARAPLGFAVAALAITALSVPLMGRLGLNGDLTALLPDSVPSVRDLQEIQRRFGQPHTFAILVTSEDARRNRAFVAALAPRLERELGDVGVTRVDWNIRDYRDFVERNRYLWVEYDRLVRLRDALEERIAYERRRANPFFVELDDPPTALEDEIEALRREAAQAEARAERYPEGFFEHEWHRDVAIFLRTDIRGGEMSRMERLIAAVDRVVADVRAEFEGDEGLLVRYGGSVMDMHAEQEALADAAVAATAVTLLLVLVAIQIFFLRWRAVPILLLGLLPPIVVTFAIAALTIEYLNASSAFLSAIVIGNGINPHIIWLARYFEDRQSGCGPEAAIRQAHLATWPGTLSASLAAAIAYASLTLTDFRAFRDFGVIGGIGMVLCWIGTFTCTPVIALLLERLRPMHAAPGARTRTQKGEGSSLYGRATLALVLRAPRAILVVAAVLTMASVAAIVPWVAGDPIEYDFRNLQSQRRDDPLQEVNRIVAGTADASTSGNGIAILVASPEDVPHVRAQLEAIERERPEVLGTVHTIFDLLPTDQERKIPVLRELRRLMLEIRPWLSEAQQREIDRHLPPEELRPVGPDDLPAMVAAPFTEIDGTRGTIIYVEHDYDQNQFDGRYLIEWTRAARSPRNRDGSPVRVTGAAPVVADLVDAILADGPRTVTASFLATLVLLLFTFARARDRALVYLTDLMGVLWMIGCMAAFGMKVNFLNFVALPVTFGLGVDYGVNVMRRYVEEERKGRPPIEAVRASLGETGGAVILCSLTTVIGYISLYTSPNLAVNSFGVAMSLAELTCLYAAVAVLPAALIVVLGRRAAGTRDLAGSEPLTKVRAVE